MSNSLRTGRSRRSVKKYHVQFTDAMAFGMWRHLFTTRKGCCKLLNDLYLEGQKFMVFAPDGANVTADMLAYASTH